MAKFNATLLAITVAAAMATPAFAADYSDGNIHKNDYKWMQFNVMHTIDQLPFTTAQDDYNDTYLEMEFGGRSGLFDLYGYVDVFDIFNTSDSDKHGTGAGKNLFMKFAPRMSLDALTGKDLSFGPVQELYIANLNNISDNMMENMVGLGADVMVPWFGKMGMNLMARHSTENDFFVEEKGDWNGYWLAINWFKPFVNFSNGSFIAYQGYLDYAFDLDKHERSDRTSNYSAQFHGIYWHSDRYAVGYGLKYFTDAYGTKDDSIAWDGSPWKSTGFSHYFDVTYKF